MSKLDEASLKVAKEELHEINETDRLLAVQTLRQWVLEQKWLRTPTGTVSLLILLKTISILYFFIFTYIAGNVMLHSTSY